METVIQESEAAILDRVIRPTAEDSPGPAAEAILYMGFAQSDLDRMTQLLEKAQLGELTTAEAAALENYRHVGRLLELMKSRARSSLKRKN